MSIEPITHEEGTHTPILGPVDCAPWCEDGDGHLDDYSCAQDQICYSKGERMQLMLENMIEGDQRKWIPSTLDISLQRNPGESVKLVTSQNECRGFKLTPDEADVLAGILTEQAAIARTGATVTTPEQKA